MNETTNQQSSQSSSNYFSSNMLGAQTVQNIPSQSPAKAADVTRIDQRRNRVTGRIVGLANIEEGVMSWLSSRNVYGAHPTSSTGSMVVISFPSMPESIELARTSEYRVAPVYMAPDGIHQYVNTSPLSIPFSFSLSIHDREYCEHGALTLLATAAKLHSLVLPIGGDINNRKLLSSRSSGSYAEAVQNSGLSSSTVRGLDSSPTSPGAKDATKDGPPAKTETSAENGNLNNFGVVGGENSTYPPVACLLDLISDGRDSAVSLGVRCIGYINQVRTRFKGPWLQPSNGGKNLPSVLECDFTFVHFPSYTNLFSENQSSIEQKLMNVYAEDVRSNFYNTAEKSYATNINIDEGLGELKSAYRGLSY